MRRKTLWLILIACNVINFVASRSKSRFAMKSRNRSCRSVGGTAGTCIVIDGCADVMNLIKSHGIGSVVVQTLLQEAGCGFERNIPKVCCPKSDSGKDASDENGNSQSSTKKKDEDLDEPIQNPLQLLPTTCGQDYANRIIGGEVTEMDEFPWMVVLEYAYPRGTTLGCGGALISKRYVLTAAHCIRSIPSNWRLRNVRLGEYNVKTDPDCVDEGNGQMTCADPVLILPVEREIVHESYGYPNPHRNDIALLRLGSNVSFTRYIQPICLANSDDVGQLYWSAGWGQVEMKSSSDIKLKVSLPYVDFNQCARRYESRKIFLGDGQMCAGGRAGKDTCKGDSGGPLMKQVRDYRQGVSRWIIDGIVSLGYSPCGLPGWPAVYTKVYNYVPWILKQLRP